MDWLTQALLEGHITFTHVVQIPQLDLLGDRLMAVAQEIRDAIDRQTAQVADTNMALADNVAALTTEIEQIAMRFMTAMTDDEKMALVTQLDIVTQGLRDQSQGLRDQTARIQNIVPDEPVPPTPEPEPVPEPVPPA